MLAYIMLFRASQPLSHDAQRLLITHLAGIVKCSILDLYVNFSMLNAQCSSLALIPHFAGHVKYPMQDSAYTTTRERMQAHTMTESGI